MKKTIIIPVFVLSVLLIASSMAFHERKNDNGEWNEKYVGKGISRASDIKQTGNGGFIVVGVTAPLSGGTWDAWLLKVDANGNEIWNKSFGGSGNDEAYSVIESKEGYMIAGSTQHWDGMDYDFWLIKTDRDGNEIWNKTYGEKGDDIAEKIIQTNDGGYAIVGYTYSFNTPGDPDILVVKTDGKGELQWYKVLGGNKTEDGNDIIETDDGYLVSGITYSYETRGGWDTWLVKIDKDGNEVWNKTYGWWDFEWNAYVIRIDDGYMIAGYTLSTPTEWGDAYLIKVDKDGNEVWSKKYGGQDSDQVYDFKKTEDGYILAGGTHTYSIGDFDAWLLKVDANGNEIWNKSFGGRGADGVNSVVVLNGSYVMAGDTETDFLSEHRIAAWVIKCEDYFPPEIKIVRPKENYLYIFDREIMPYDKTMAIGGVTVVVDSNNSAEIDRVEFYFTGYNVYEYKPRAVVYNPPYEWKCRRFGIGLPGVITAGAYYGNAGGVAVDKIEVYIINI